MLVKAILAKDGGAVDRPCTDVHKEAVVDRPEEATTAEDSSRPPGRPTVVPEFKQRVGSMCVCLTVD